MHLAPLELHLRDDGFGQRVRHSLAHGGFDWLTLDAGVQASHGVHRRSDPRLLGDGDSPAVFDRLLGLLVGYPGGGKQVHDANLVATMLGYGVTRILTFTSAVSSRRSR